jgi:hypothetical protein
VKEFQVNHHLTRNKILRKQLFSIQDILSNPFKLIQDSYLLLRIFLASLVLCNFLKCLDLQDIHLWSFSKLYQQL